MNKHSKEELNKNLHFGHKQVFSVLLSCANSISGFLENLQIVCSLYVNVFSSYKQHDNEKGKRNFFRWPEENLPCKV